MLKILTNIEMKLLKEEKNVVSSLKNIGEMHVFVGELFFTYNLPILLQSRKWRGTIYKLRFEMNSSSRPLLSMKFLAASCSLGISPSRMASLIVK